MTRILTSQKNVREIEALPTHPLEIGARVHGNALTHPGPASLCSSRAMS
jgi:hypothetical protein